MKKKQVALYACYSVLTVAVLVGTLFASKHVIGTMQRTSMTVILDARESAISHGESLKQELRLSQAQVQKLLENACTCTDDTSSVTSCTICNTYTDYDSCAICKSSDVDDSEPCQNSAHQAMIDMANSNEYIVLTTDGDMAYLIQKGDTLSEISSVVYVSVDELAEYNGIKNVNMIYAGSSLRVPYHKTAE